jgi:hypothetical protein
MTTCRAGPTGRMNSGGRELVALLGGDPHVSLLYGLTTLPR